MLSACREASSPYFLAIPWAARAGKILFSTRLEAKFRFQPKNLSFAKSETDVFSVLRSKLKFFSFLAIPFASRAGKILFSTRLEAKLGLQCFKPPGAKAGPFSARKGSWRNGQATRSCSCVFWGLGAPSNPIIYIIFHPHAAKAFPCPCSSF